MFFISKLLNEIETRSHEKLPDEDLISIFAFIAETTRESITDYESTSKLMFRLLSQLNQLEFYDKYLRILIDNNERKYIHIQHADGRSAYRIYVKDKFIFQVILLTSLKYMKDIIMIDQSPENRQFFQRVLKIVLESIHIDKPQSLQLLKLMEILLKKREDVLTGDLPMCVLHSMNKVACSPLSGFKHSAHIISKLTLKSLSSDEKKHLCDLNSLPIKGIELKDILCLFKDEEVRKCSHVMNQHIMNLFCNNTDSRNGSFYYETLINSLSFEQFIEDLWPRYYGYLEYFENEGEFHQSLLKYWIPLSVKQYRNRLYLFIKDKNVDFHFKSYILLETKRKGSYDRSTFIRETLIYLQYARTNLAALKIISTYTKKCIYPDEFEIRALEYFVASYSTSEFSEEILKYFRLFFSHLFLTCHIALSKNPRENLDRYLKLLNFIYQFCIANIDDVETCEPSAQLLGIIWESAAGPSSNLIINYKVDRENVYEIRGNLYYQLLEEVGFWQRTFTNTTLINKIANFLRRKSTHCPVLIEIVIEHYLPFISDDFGTLTSLLTRLNSRVSLQSSEKMRIYSKLIIAHRKLTGVNSEREIHAMKDLFFENIANVDLQGLFSCVLILDVFLGLDPADPLDHIALIQASLDFFEIKIKENFHCELDVKTSKVLEALINNTIDCLILLKDHWSKFPKDQILRQLCVIIQYSNMKRPVSMSIIVVKHLGAIMESNPNDRKMKIELLNKTLVSLCEAPSKINVKIRRNPETRLVIHALCLSETNPLKSHLDWSLKFMLKVLSDPLSLDSTLSSTLHCIEVLVSDNTIHQLTLRYIPEIVKHCILVFDKTSWIVRNADLQLLKSLIERFLGVLLDYCRRPKTIEDVFVLFPRMTLLFYQILSAPILSDSAVIVLLFFSESQMRNNLLINENLQAVIDDFSYLLMDIILKYSNNFGFLAMKAFVSLCLDFRIPATICEVSAYISQNFSKIDKNIFANLIKLLQELDGKYRQSLDKSGAILIGRAHSGLVSYLRPFDDFYFDLLSLKVHSCDFAVNKITFCLNGEIDYQQRIWLNNFLPSVISEIDIGKLGGFLERILFLQIPDFLQISLLNALVDRLLKPSPEMIAIINTLILKLTHLPDKNLFLIMAYAKTILLFHEILCNFTLDEKTVDSIRCNFHTESIYKIFVYVTALAHVEEKIEIDELFLTRSIKNYTGSMHEDYETLCDLCATLPYLYTASKVNSKFDILKLAFYLLLNHFTAFEICKFISIISNRHCGSVVATLKIFLDLDFLISCLGSEKVSVELLLSFYNFLDTIPDELEESETYYLVENDFSIPRRFVKRRIIRVLSKMAV